MIHVDESTLLAYLDEEASAPRKEVAGHLVACPQCAAELQALRDMTADLRSALAIGDVPAPVAAARARFDEARREVHHGSWRAVRFGPFRIGLLQAAVLALFLAGVAGAAIPGSPLRLWLESTLSGEDERSPAVVAPGPAVPPSADSPVPAVAAAELNQMRIPPVDGHILIVLREPPATARLIVRLADDDDDRAKVEAAASFTTGVGRLEAFAIANDEVIVTLPRTVASARIEVDGRLLVLREGGSYTHLPPNAVQDGDAIVIPLNR